jgi:hypothetical protein
MSLIFIYLSIIFGFISPIIGIYFILKGNFHPQRTTRLILAIITFLFVATLYAQGDRNGLFLAIPSFIGCLTMFFLSIPYGTGGFKPFDFVVFNLAMTTMVVWKTTNNPVLGLYMSILTDLIGFTPSLIKMWHQPQTEEWKFYLSDVFAGVFSVLSVTTFNLNALAFPTYILLINTTSVLMILLRRQRLKLFS